MGNKEMAKELNLYFASVFTKEDMNNIPEVLRERCFSEELKEISISREMVLGKLMGLKVDKSPGPDNLHPRVLKEVALEIDALVVIFQNSLDSGLVPTDWRVANVSPIFKKGGREKTGNYRPVSLTLVLGKLLESIIKDFITRHLEGSGIIKQAWIYKREIMLDESIGIL